jgi:predicted ArsR family transcriptional regulator
MFNEAFRDLSKPQLLNLIEAIKKSQGMAVADLARELEMSYMGVKQHCQKLEVMGYLKTWRVPRSGVGRPEKLYKLTSKCDELFPQPGSDLILNVMEGMQKFFGESSPEKIFFHHFEKLRDDWSVTINKGKSLVEKATRLADLRDKSGCFSRCKYDVEFGFRIEEYHNPLIELFQKYPNLIKQEIRMMEQLLGSKVKRQEVEMEKGGTMVIYQIGTLG